MSIGVGRRYQSSGARWLHPPAAADEAHANEDHAEGDEAHRQQVRTHQEWLAREPDDALEEQAEDGEEGKTAAERPEAGGEQVRLALHQPVEDDPTPVAPGPTSAHAYAHVAHSPVAF